MMKRVMILGILTVSLIVVTGSLQSQTAVTIGGHYWYAMLDYNPSDFENVEVDPGNMFGPYLNLRVGKLAIGSSMFWGTFDMDFGRNVNFYDRWDDYYVYTGDANLVLSNNRKDLNFSLGYSIFPRFTLFAAMKYISFKIDKDFPVLGVDFYDANYVSESKGTLYGGGVSGVLPFARSSIFLFWSAAYLSGTLDTKWTFSVENQDQNEGEGEFDTTITAITAGLGFQMGSGLTIMVGYRSDFSGEDEEEEKIHGIMATMAYTIR